MLGNGFDVNWKRCHVCSQLCIEESEILSCCVHAAIIRFQYQQIMRIKDSSFVWILYKNLCLWTCLTICVIRTFIFKPPMEILLAQAIQIARLTSHYKICNWITWCRILLGLAFNWQRTTFYANRWHGKAIDVRTDAQSNTINCFQKFDRRVSENPWTKFAQLNFNGMRFSSEFNTQKKLYQFS